MRQSMKDYIDSVIRATREATDQGVSFQGENAWNVIAHLGDKRREDALREAASVIAAVEQEGGRGWCFPRKRSVLLELQGVPEESRTPSSLFGKGFELVECYHLRSPNWSEFLVRKDCWKGKLTEGFVFALPDGAIIVSCCWAVGGTPRFVGEVIRGESRETLWRNILTRDAHRLCRVFGSYETMEWWMS